MIPRRLVAQIEAEAGRLAREVMNGVKEDPRTPGYHAMPDADLRPAVDDILRNLGQWLSSRGTEAIENRYRRIGIRRRHAGIPMSEILRAQATVKQAIQRYIRRSLLADPADIVYEADLSAAVSEFFDTAMYGIALGYESAGEAAATARDAEPLPPAVPPRAPSPRVAVEAEWDPTNRSGEIGETAG